MDVSKHGLYPVEMFSICTNGQPFHAKTRKNRPNRNIGRDSCGVDSLRQMLRLGPVHGATNSGGQSPKCIKTHVVRVSSLVVSGSTVAILHDSNEEMMRIATWDVKGRQLHHFRIVINQGASSEMYSYFVMVTSDEKSIIFFERVFDESTYVRFTKMNLKGQIESSGRMEHPNIGNYIIQPESRTAAYTTGCVTIWSFAGRRQELDSHQANPTPWEVLRVCYDTNTDRLELQRHTLDCSTRARLSTRDLLWWNDVAYFGSYAHRAGELEVLDLKASVCKKAEMSASILVPGITEPSMDTGVCFGKPFHAPDSLLLGNESFVISVQYV